MVSSTREKEEAIKQQQLLPVVRQAAAPTLCSLCSLMNSHLEARRTEKPLQRQKVLSSPFATLLTSQGAWKQLQEGAHGLLGDIPS